MLDWQARRYHDCISEGFEGGSLSGEQPFHPDFFPEGNGAVIGLVAYPSRKMYACPSRRLAAAHGVPTPPIDNVMAGVLTVLFNPLYPELIPSLWKQIVHMTNNFGWLPPCLPSVLLIYWWSVCWRLSSSLCSLPGWKLLAAGWLLFIRQSQAAEGVAVLHCAVTSDRSESAVLSGAYRTGRRWNPGSVQMHLSGPDRCVWGVVKEYRVKLFWI